MHTQKDRAIILRRKPLGEADLLLTLLTEKNGKVRVVAKGARKITSKLLGFTELFTIISCQIDFRPSIPIISQISHEKLFDGIADNQALYQRLHIVAELIDRGTQEQESDPLLFRSLKEGITQLVTIDHPLIFSAVLLRLASILGFEPRLGECAACARALETHDQFGWSPNHGGVVHKHEDNQAIALTTDALKVLRYLQKSSYTDIAKLRVPKDFADTLEDCLLAYVQHVLEEEFASKRVVSAQAG